MDDPRYYLDCYIGTQSCGSKNLYVNEFAKRSLIYGSNFSTSRLVTQLVFDLQL